MKNLLLLLVILIVSSCGYTTPKIGSETEPFIVIEIQHYNEKQSRYIGSPNADDNEISVFCPAIILPTGMFNMGDTILPQDFIK
jgi:hypothetical protein